MNIVDQIKPEKRYLLANEEDINLNLRLKTNFNELNEFNNTRIISLSELFTKERNESTKYRIYGVINYLSFLRNKNTTTKTLNDLFSDDNTANIFNFEDYFELKLFRPIQQQTYFDISTRHYAEKLTAITETKDSKLNYYAYSKNIFNERNYSFMFNTVNVNPNEIVELDKEFIYNNNIYLGFIPKNNFVLYEKVYDAIDYVDYLDPLTEFGYDEQSLTDALLKDIYDFTDYSLADFKKYFLDKLKFFLKTYNIRITAQNINLNIRFIRNYLEIGNNDYYNPAAYVSNQTIFEGDFIQFDRENYLFNRRIKKEYLIVLVLTDTFQGLASEFNSYVNSNYSAFTKTVSTASQTVEVKFRFKYNPFYPIELKKYTTYLEQINPNLRGIPIPPDNAIRITAAISDNDRIIWRNLMPYGDPDNYDNPFINNTHYFFNDIIFMMKPDFSDRNTGILFNDFLLNFTNNRYNFKKSNIKIKPEVAPGLCE